MMSLWDALRMNMMISYQELVRTFLNLTAFSVTLVAVILSLGGKFIHFMEPLSRVSWFVGVIVAFAAYALLKKRTTAEKTGEQKTIG